MAGFRKAKPAQGALKMAFFGPQGSGKTLTGLLVAEGLAKLSGKRIAMVDTESGADFYAMHVEQRRVHPEAFDFDALYSRSITEISAALKALDPNVYGVIKLDSITHIWDACKEAYRGKKKKDGGLPMYAWAQIKKPYKDLMTWLLNCPMHVIVCGREGTEFEEDETGETKSVGAKMKAEGETAYEFNHLLHFESVRVGKRRVHEIQCFVEKDRSGVLTGKVIKWPNFDSIAAPILGLLGSEQRQIQTIDEAGNADAETLSESAKKFQMESAEHRRKFLARFELAESIEELDKAAKHITPGMKGQMTREHVADLKDAYTEHVQRLREPAPIEQEATA